MPYTWTEPELVVSHLSVSVYNVYKDGFWGSGRRLHQFTTDITEQAEPFDIRGLPSYKEGLATIPTLMLAIERGEIKTPEE